MQSTRLTQSRQHVALAIPTSASEYDDNRSLGECYGAVKDGIADLEGVVSGAFAENAPIQAESVCVDSMCLLMEALDMAGLPSSPAFARAFAVGVYTEQEGKKDDKWRDEPVYDPTENTDIYRHLDHEIDEVQRNINDNELDYLVHNAADLVTLSAILRAAALRRDA